MTQPNFTSQSFTSQGFNLDPMKDQNLEIKSAF